MNAENNAFYWYPRLVRSLHILHIGSATHTHTQTNTFPCVDVASFVRFFRKDFINMTNYVTTENESHGRPQGTQDSLNCCVIIKVVFTVVHFFYQQIKSSWKTLIISAGLNVLQQQSQ